MKHQPKGWLFLMKKVVLPPLRIWFPAMVNVHHHLKGFLALTYAATENYQEALWERRQENADLETVFRHEYSAQ